jgi:hypothetical protein
MPTESKSTTTQTADTLQVEEPQAGDERFAANFLSRQTGVRYEPATMAAWRDRRMGPRYLKLGPPRGRGRVVYRVADLLAFLEASVVDPRKKQRP